MGLLTTRVRHALLAVLIASPLPMSAEVVARYEVASGQVHVTGLDDEQRNEIVASPNLMTLRVARAASTRGTPFGVTETSDGLLLTPRFTLRKGTDYELELDGIKLPISLPALEAPQPRLTGLSPSQGVVPSNTLRMYLHFSEPMARGQIRDSIRLTRADGTEIANPFLTLGPELWNGSQTRITLLFDPGRIKQGVGPNATVGPPLIANESYLLEISGEMESAAGKALGSDIFVAFQAGPAERRPIDPTSWQLLLPPPGTQETFTVAFDRIVDIGIAQRFLKLRDPNGQILKGHIQTDGGGWSITPETPWIAGDYVLVVDPEFEDISGNTPSVPFDAKSGTIGTGHSAIERHVSILP